MDITMKSYLLRNSVKGITSYFSFLDMAYSKEKTRLQHILKMPQLKVITNRGIFSTERRSQGPFSDVRFSLL